MAISLDDLAANTEVREQLGATCDFDVGGAGRQIGFTVEGADEVAVVARDGGGGVFAVVAPSPRVLFVSAEGQAGIVARDLDALVTLVVLCPYWRDVLKFSGGGRLEEMRRAAPLLENVWLDEEEDFADSREFLTAELGLSEPDDLVGTLHRMVSQSHVAVRAADGTAADSLFGRFTIDDNPLLKALAG
ncbi:MAG: hypothetical protein ACJ8FP_05980 [Xanthobacteraceae bacterium]